MSFCFLFKDISLDSVVVDHQDNSFRVEISIEDYSYLMHLGEYFISLLRINILLFISTP